MHSFAPPPTSVPPPNGAHKTPRKCIRAWFFIASVCMLGALAACMTNPRRITPDRSAFRETRDDMEGDATKYANRWIDQPEMWPREMTMPERRLMLMVNWAMQKSAQEGRQKVRVIYAPLQLTGDTSIDHSVTHEIVVVADELPAGKTFSEVYEVRIGPVPDLAVIGPATTATNLVATDMILAEQELARLKIDSASLTAATTGMTNYLQMLAQSLASAEATINPKLEELSTKLAELKTKTDELAGTLTTLSNSISTARSNIAAQSAIILEQTNAWKTAESNHTAYLKRLEEAKKAYDKAKSDNTTNSPPALAAKQTMDEENSQQTTKEAAQRDAETKYKDAQTNLKKTKDELEPLEKQQQTKTTELNKAQNDTREREDKRDALKAELKKISDKVGQAQIAKLENASYLAAVSSLTNFWQKWAAGREDYTYYSKSGTSQTNQSAICIRIRGRALAAMSAVTLDIIERNQLAGEEKGRAARTSPFSGPRPLPSQPGVTAPHLNNTLVNFEVLLARLSGLLMAEARQVQAESRWRQVSVAGGRLVVLQKELETYVEHPDLAFPGSVEQGRAVKVEARLEAIQQMNASVTNLMDKLQRQYVMSENTRPHSIKALTGVRGALAKVKILQASQPLSEDDRAALRQQEPGGELVQRIREGKQAVFRLNVVRGMVTTTAHLLADDAAAQLFGQSFADEFHAAQVTFRNPNSNPILLYGNTMKLVVRMNAVLPFGLGEDGELQRSRWWATYEPLDYESLRRMMETQQEHSWQKNLSSALDLALAAGGGWLGVGGGGVDYPKAFGVISAIAPSLRTQLEKDLKRYATNFRDRGLNSIEEIQPNGVLTRYVFLPKGPIYGTYAYDEAEANDLPLSSSEKRWVPFAKDARDFGKRALQPAYIHDVRREEVYVEGKRILKSDPLTASGTP